MTLCINHTLCLTLCINFVFKNWVIKQVETTIFSLSLPSHQVDANFFKSNDASRIVYNALENLAAKTETERQHKPQQMDGRKYDLKKQKIYLFQNAYYSLNKKFEPSNLLVLNDFKLIAIAGPTGPSQIHSYEQKKTCGIFSDPIIPQCDYTILFITF